MVIVIFSCFSVCAEENKSDTLTITCQKDDIILSNMEWKIYKVAEIQNNSYELTGDFQNYSVNLNGLSTSQLQAAAVTLETYAAVDKISPLNTGLTNNKGQIAFGGLDFGLYLVAGESVIASGKCYVPSPSLIVLDDSDDKGLNWKYDVNATPKLRVLPESMRIYSFDCTVKKTWTDDSESIRPKSVTAVLTKNGEEFRTVELNEENNWQYKWENLSSEYKWKVIEKDVPENYTVTYTENDIKTGVNSDPDKEFIINNTYSEPPTTIQTQQVSASTQPAPEKLPQTGQLWWPVPVMSAVGLVTFSAGWKLNSCKRKKNEKAFEYVVCNF